MLESIHAGKTASITEFKKNPQALIDAAEGEAIGLTEVTVLSNLQPVSVLREIFYGEHPGTQYGFSTFRFRHSPSSF